MLDQLSSRKKKGSVSPEDPFKDGGSLMSYVAEKDPKAEEDDGVFGLTLIQEREDKSPILIKQGEEPINFL